MEDPHGTYTGYRRVQPKHYPTAISSQASRTKSLQEQEENKFQGLLFCTVVLPIQNPLPRPRPFSSRTHASPAPCPQTIGLIGELSILPATREAI